MSPAPRRIDVAGIPVLVIDPERAPSRLVLWQTHLGGAKEQTVPQLRALAGQGCRAVSFDPPGHGDRSDGGDARRFAADVLAHFRLRMWPILGQTTLEALRVLDAVSDPGITQLAAGGVSMGGDVAIALAGIEPGIDRVAALGSTPDWSRPGMTRIDAPDTLVQQGRPDRYGAWLRDQLDPMLHLERYRRGVPMRLHCGGDDHHVPQANGRAFAAALAGAGPVEILGHPGLDHFGVCVDADAVGDCAAFLAG
jgi:uncharacterized protein